MARDLSGSGAEERAGSEEEHEPDYRYTLANERTFLAYIRTALALDVSGLAIAQFFHRSLGNLRLLIGIVLVTLGVLVALLGYRRWRSTERAMRRGGGLPPARLPPVLALGLVLASIAALALVISSR